MFNEQNGQQTATGGFESLFASESRNTAFGGANQLDKTAQLTTEATAIVNNILQALAGLTARDSETEMEYRGKAEAAMKSHDMMDDLINDLYPLDEVNVEYLKVESNDTLEKMIRSQQSKRSRSKSKNMTFENWRTMMIGAVSENLLRIALGKPKSAGGAISAGELGFSDAELEELAADLEKLKKAIRNVQSKKSIFKSKAEFEAEGGEQSERWQQLLQAEAQLKALRDSGAATVNEEAKAALEANQKAVELLEDIDVSSLSDEEKDNLIASVRDMLASR